MDRLSFFPPEDVIRQYRQVFTQKGGEEITIDMLFDFGVFEESKDNDDVVLRNYGIRLLKILGGGQINRETIREFIKRLVRQPLKQVGDTDQSNMEV